MFELHEKIQELENKLVVRVAECKLRDCVYRYSKEKAELDLVEERLAVVDGEKQVIVEEQQREEARVSDMDLVLMIGSNTGDIPAEEYQD